MLSSLIIFSSITGSITLVFALQRYWMDDTPGLLRYCLSSLKKGRFLMRIASNKMLPKRWFRKNRWLIIRCYPIPTPSRDCVVIHFLYHELVSVSHSILILLDSETSSGWQVAPRQRKTCLAWRRGVSTIPESGTKNLDFKKLKFSLRMIWG